MKLVAYLRVSTDDKNQDPERQRPVLEAKARASGHEIMAWVIDEGSKAGEKAIPTFDRPKVKDAIKLAKKLKADGLMVESVDRWTRKGADDLGYSMFVLRRDHGLEGALVFADMPDDPFAREILPPIMAVLARLDNKRRSDQAKSSMARKKALGVRIGRPPKPPMTDQEYHEIAMPLLAQGSGLRKVAIAISQQRLKRGDGEVFDAKARRGCTVGTYWVAKELDNRQKSEGLSRRVRRTRSGYPSGNGPLSQQSVEA